MRTNAAVATASLILLALAGCSAVAAPTPTQTPTSTPVAAAPLTCDDLVPAGLVADTLEGADGVPVEPVAAVKTGDEFESIVLEGAGGLACSWRVGSGMPEYNAPSDWAYLRVDVLPGAAAQWQPFESEGRPSTDTRQVAGIEASVSGGDAGWAISAPVGDSWVHATIRAAGLTGSGSRFGALAGGGMMDRLVEVAASAFAAIEQADAAQLVWPAMELRQNDAICNGGLDEQGIVAALQLPEESTVEYVTVEPDAAGPRSFEEAVNGAARTFACGLQVDGIAWVRISTARGFAPLFDRLLTPDADAAFTPLELADAPAGARAVTDSENSRASTVYLAIGDSLYKIKGTGAPAVAQAIIAQTY
ncbi:hypothetical protein [Agromyces albus]|uniref:DUF3515 family protein n=1 Tax=Agromyces albus TaxID=205332 RepID=A0A4Q2L8M3_9MICO|nr:hypothetical protein [Agromyces albus]RXZ72892.1 hypothetical protein ESP51_01285 [Agromyces albus]